MVTVNSIGGAYTCVVLRCQVKVLEALQKHENAKFLKIHLYTVIK